MLHKVTSSPAWSLYQCHMLNLGHHCGICIIILQQQTVDERFIMYRNMKCGSHHVAHVSELYSSSASVRRWILYRGNFVHLYIGNDEISEWKASHGAGSSVACSSTIQYEMSSAISRNICWQCNRRRTELARTTTYYSFYPHPSHRQRQQWFN